MKFYKHMLVLFFLLTGCSVTVEDKPVREQYQHSVKHSTCFWDNTQRKDVDLFIKYPGCDPRRDFPQMVNIPNFKNAWQIMHSCDKYSPNKVSAALQTFYRHWKIKFGDPENKVWNRLNTILIEWGLEKKTSPVAFSIDGKTVKKPVILGLALSPSSIWVHTSKEPMHRTMGTTSLIHELVHISLWSSAPHFKPDMDHEGPAYEGWDKKHTSFIFDVNFKLMYQGL